MIVSFRLEAMCDFENLQNVLNERWQGKYRVANIEGGFVELSLDGDLTIDKLFAAMKMVPDGHIMFETLRSARLSENSMIRRYSNAAPACWKS